MKSDSKNQLNGRPIVYNIGYQFLSPEKLVERISENGITVLVDVRRVADDSAYGGQAAGKPAFG